MRKIKFRAVKDDPSYKFVYGYLSYHVWNNIPRIHSIIDPDRRTTCLAGTEGQFAFKSNDQDIYEGDVIEIDSTEIGGNKVIGEVAFNTDPTLSYLGWGLWIIEDMARYKELGHHSGWMNTDFMGRIKIIGNKHKVK